MFAILFWAVIVGLIILFFISLFSFVSRVSHNASAEKNETIVIVNEEKLDLIIEQNKQIISLLEDKK